MRNVLVFKSNIIPASLLTFSSTINMLELEKSLNFMPTTFLAAQRIECEIGHDLMLQEILYVNGNHPKVYECWMQLTKTMKYFSCEMKYRSSKHFTSYQWKKIFVWDWPKMPCRFLRPCLRNQPVDIYIICPYWEIGKPFPVLCKFPKFTAPSRSIAEDVCMQIWWNCGRFGGISFSSTGIHRASQVQRDADNSGTAMQQKGKRHAKFSLL